MAAILHWGARFVKEGGAAWTSALQRLGAQVDSSHPLGRGPGL